VRPDGREVLVLSDLQDLRNSITKPIDNELEQLANDMALKFSLEIKKDDTSKLQNSMFGRKKWQRLAA
jgi:hypothetical protein